MLKLRSNQTDCNYWRLSNFEEKRRPIKEKAKQHKRIDRETRRILTSDEEDGEDAECLYCYHLFSKSNQECVKCTVCLLWRHCRTGWRVRWKHDWYEDGATRIRQWKNPFFLYCHTVLESGNSVLYMYIKYLFSIMVRSELFREDHCS